MPLSPCTGSRKTAHVCGPIAASSAAGSSAAATTSAAAKDFGTLDYRLAWIKNVEFAGAYIADKKVANAQRYLFSAWFQAIDTPDKNTVILRMEPERPAALDMLEQLNMVDSESMSGPDAAKTAVGTDSVVYGVSSEGDTAPSLRKARRSLAWAR